MSDKLRRIIFWSGVIAFIALMFTLLCFSLVDAQTYEFAGGYYKEVPRLDGWTSTWVVGGIGTYYLTGLTEMEQWERFGLCVGSALLYEVYKDAYRNDVIMPYDPAGADLAGDLCPFVIGVCLGYIMEKVSTRHMYYAVTRNGITILVEF